MRDKETKKQRDEETRHTQDTKRRETRSALLSEEVLEKMVDDRLVLCVRE